MVLLDVRASGERWNEKRGTLCVKISLRVAQSTQPTDRLLDLYARVTRERHNCPEIARVGSSP